MVQTILGQQYPRVQASQTYVESQLIESLLGFEGRVYLCTSATWGNEYLCTAPDSLPITKILSEAAIQHIGSRVA